MLACPVCGGALDEVGRAMRCKKGHHYDMAAQGYVYLLQANQKHSKTPGDDLEMVHKRTRFLDSGSYQPLSDRLNQTILSLCGTQMPRILDAGCGEGYYAARLYEALTQAGKKPAVYGIDLAKPAVRHAAVRCKPARFAVASLFRMPVVSGSMDVCYNVFSPLCPEEFLRVLAPGGFFVAVYPAPRHLFGLKEILYEQPYENREEDYQLEGFQIREKERLHYRFSLEGQELIESLFGMTPYYYKTPKEGCKRLQECEFLQTEADFWIVSYQKEGA